MGGLSTQTQKAMAAWELGNWRLAPRLCKGEEGWAESMGEARISGKLGLTGVASRRWRAGRT